MTNNIKDFRQAIIDCVGFAKKEDLIQIADILNGHGDLCAYCKCDDESCSMEYCKTGFEDWLEEQH